ncbi:endonuclease domain-containing protein [Blastococcus xanthinilyticus]|uniref:Uncharacterized protein DUF559 n=1 Tax=Blastococcus xanthinilyticus TaxID=1564164 RepID=A0A5S5CTR1_9ACTN|nr:DUF559 domain-containing protein [Blastococcus xanthinilyticus]TYP84970.1 uncharacterized protein DUF559 [Blastococcus xanthinilyticus]
MDRIGLPPAYTRPEAAAAGLTRAQLRDDGVRVTRGAYVSTAVPLGLRAACLAALPVLPAGTVFSHRTAATLLGAPLRAGWPVHLTVPPGTHRPRRARFAAHVCALGEGDVTTEHGLPLTSGVRTWLDLAGLLPPGELLAVGDALMRAGHLDAATLAHRLAGTTGRRGVVTARALAGHLTPLAASCPESLVRHALLSSDLPGPEVQVPVQDPRGRVVAHADLGYRRWKIAVEYEGRQHAERAQFDRDIDRYSLMAADGWLVLRFGHAVLGRLGTVVDRTRRALISRGATW